MIFISQSGALLCVKATLMVAMVVFAALTETTEAFLIDCLGRHHIKTSKQITSEEILEVVQPEKM